MLSSRFADIPISSSIIDGSGVPQLLNRGEQTLRAVTGSGGRLHFGMVAGIKSECPPGLRRNSQPDERLALVGNRRAWRGGCGHDASLGQRLRVAHMPKAESATALGGIELKRERSGRASN